MWRAFSSRRLLAATALFSGAAAFNPSPAHAHTTALYLESQPGDYVGAGETHTWTDADVPFTARIDSGYPALIVTVGTSGQPVSWTLKFDVPHDAPLAPGVYENAAWTRWWSRATARLSISASSRYTRALRHP